ncbi:hypothetical protein HDU91_000508 [Kappamyces sp. JEL0680]|nr:hypothetical protein HDU91_000508 [Kappamyces sp. JEL0680]
MRALEGVRVVEFAGLAPGPFAGMILADFGAEVIRIDNSTTTSTTDVLARGKKSIQVNLKSKQGIEIAMALLAKSDVVIDTFRPGVLERLGLGPETVLAKNPRIVFARLTGFGQTGAYRRMAGHDVNYIAITGVLSMIGTKAEPVFPANLLGDFAAGSCLCVVGILMALLQRASTGKGQVIDANMVDGTAYLASFLFKMQQYGAWNEPRGHNLLDGGAPFYQIYKTLDGQFMAVGAIEPQFWDALLKGSGLDPRDLPDRMDPQHWPALQPLFAKVFAAKTQKQWCEIFDGTDACVTPVVLKDNAGNFPVNRERRLFYETEQGIEPRPAPRLSASKPLPAPPPQPEMGQHTGDVLADLLGLGADQIQSLSEQKVVTLGSKL